MYMVIVLYKQVKHWNECQLWMLMTTNQLHGHARLLTTEWWAMPYAQDTVGQLTQWTMTAVVRNHGHCATGWLGLHGQVLPLLCDVVVRPLASKPEFSLLPLNKGEWLFMWFETCCCVWNRIVVALGVWVQNTPPCKPHAWAGEPGRDERLHTKSGYQRDSHRHFSCCVICCNYCWQLDSAATIARVVLL